MNKKFFLYGMIALLGASLFFLGCPTDGDDGEKTPEKTAAEKVGDDFGAKASVSGSVVTLNDDVSLDKAVTVAEGVTLTVSDGKTLTVTTGGSLTVTGTLSGVAGAKIVVAGTGTVTSGNFYDENGELLTAIAAGTYNWVATPGVGQTPAEGWKRVRSGTVTGTAIDGTVGTALVAKTVTISVADDAFKAIAPGADLKAWITNLPAGLAATASAAVAENGTSVTIAVAGTPSAASNSVLAVTIPGTALLSGAPLAVTPDAAVKFAIVTNVAAAYSVAADNAINASMDVTDFILDITSAIQDADGTVTITLAGDFAADYLYVADGIVAYSDDIAGAKFDTRNYNLRSEVETAKPATGTYGAININGLFSATEALTNIAIRHTNPSFAFFSEAAGLSTTPTDKPGIGNGDGGPTSLICIPADGSTPFRWTIYPTIPQNDYLTVLLYSEGDAADKKLDLLIEEYSGNTTSATKVDGGFSKHVIIDYSAVVFLEADDGE